MPAQAQTPEEITRFIIDAAVHAPSVLNTQPWWLSYGDLGITVHADPDRKLRVADPGGREMIISCGAALLTARVALRQLGYVPKVTVLPDPDKPNLAARISWDRQVPPSEFERQLFAEVERRHTHRGGFSAAPLPADLLDALRAEAAKENARLGIVADGGQQSALAGSWRWATMWCGRMKTGPGNRTMGTPAGQLPPRWRAAHCLPGGPRPDGTVLRRP